MRIGAKYSHLNGEEYLIVRRERLWNEVQEVITRVEASTCRAPTPEDKTEPERTSCSPGDINQAFGRRLRDREWRDRNDLLREVYGQPSDRRRQAIEDATGIDPKMSKSQTYFFKNRVAVEVKFGGHAFAAHGLFAEHLGAYVSDLIDVGIAIVPMNNAEGEMPSSVPYEGCLSDILRHGRGVPGVPLVLVGVKP